MRAKMQVQSLTQYIYGSFATLQCVTDGGEDNKDFADRTPSGKLEMMITNPHAQGYFQPGQEFYVDFSKAPKA